LVILHAVVVVKCHQHAQLPSCNVKEGTLHMERYTQCWTGLSRQTEPYNQLDS
jgi:hypothetical protein